MRNSLKSYLEHNIRKLLDQDEQEPDFSLQGGLRLISAVYKDLVRARTNLYASHRIPRKKLPCPVISIGNIIAGGAGKTPVAISVARMIEDMGKCCVIISRGYKGNSSVRPFLVGDGKQVLATPADAGDEPCMMAKDFSLAVVVGKNRYQAGKLALKTLSPDVIILDDGFQHLALHRDLDILLLDHDRPFGNQRLLPAGLLREPVADALKRTHVIVRTRCPERPSPFLLPENLSGSSFKGPVLDTRHNPDLIHWQDQNQKPLPLEIKKLSGQKAVLFSGIARNNAFRKTVEKMGCTITTHLEFSDHHRYTQADIDQINQQMKQNRVFLAVTTQKDMIKLDPHTRWAGQLAVVGIHIQWEDETKIRKILSQTLARTK